MRSTARELASPPAFVVGEMRSGTSLLYRMIQTHSAFAPRVGVHLTETHAVKLLADLQVPDPADQPLVEFMLDDKQEFDEFMSDIAPLRARREMDRRTFPNLRRNRRIWTLSGEHLVLQRYFVRAADVRGARRLVEKTADNLPWLRHLQIAFPRAQFLYIVRHPVDTLASFRRRYELDPTGSSWADVGPQEFRDRWQANVRMARRLANRNSSHLMLMRYEDLTRDTERTVRRVLEHLGEPFEEGCLLSKRLEGYSSTIDPDLFDAISEQTNDWEDHVTMDWARRVERGLEAEMSALGYSAYTTN